MRNDPALPYLHSVLDEEVEGSDGWYTVNGSTYEDEPPYYAASMFLMVGEREIVCRVGSRELAAVRAGLAACSSLRENASKGAIERTAPGG